MSGKKVNSKKAGFNMYEFTNRNKKKVVGSISILIVASMLLGILAQFAI